MNKWKRTWLWWTTKNRIYGRSTLTAESQFDYKKKQYNNDNNEKLLIQSENSNDMQI